jgi:hypothetical protein
MDIIEEYELSHVQFLGKSVPLSYCLLDLQQQVDSRTISVNSLNLWTVKSVQQLVNCPTQCSKKVVNFLSKFSGKQEEIARKIYHCKLNKKFSQPSLIATMLQRFFLWKKQEQMQPKKFSTGVIGHPQNISP